MNPSLCPCGKRPAIVHKKLKHMRVVQIVCACGNCGAELAYVRLSDKAQLVRGAVECWDKINQEWVIPCIP